MSTCHGWGHLLLICPHLGGALWGCPLGTALQPPGTSLSSGFRSWPRHLSTSTHQGEGLGNTTQ